MSNVTLANPYQKFGYEVPEGMTAADALAEAGMTGWNQRLVQPLVMDGATEYPAGRFRFNVADLPTGPRILGAVKATYRPIQIEEAFLPLMDGFAEEGLRPAVVGAYDDGAAAFIQFDLPEGKGWAEVNGDTISTTLLLTKRNDGTGAVLAFPVAERVRCANQINGIVSRKVPTIAVRHTKHADPYVAQAAERLLGITQDWETVIGNEIAELCDIEMDYRRYADEFVPTLLGDRPEDEGRGLTIWDNKAEALVAAWYSPVAAEGDTAWRAWNAVSEWEQHHRTGNEARMARAVLHGRQPISDRALALLTA